MIALLVAWFSIPATGDETIAREYHSHVLGNDYLVAIPSQALRRAPKWAANAANPPLPARKAIDEANKLRERLAPAPPDERWTIESASLVQVADTWVWLIEYQIEGANGDPDTLKLVVLMDGTVPEPRVGKDR
jgi:hypothetical protein